MTGLRFAGYARAHDGLRAEGHDKRQCGEPRPSTRGSKTTPDEGSARRASPIGASGDSAVASVTAPAAAASPTSRFRAIPSTTSWRWADAEGGQRRVLLALDHCLAAGVPGR